MHFSVALCFMIQPYSSFKRYRLDWCKFLNHYGFFTALILMMIFILKKDDDENSLFFYQAVSLFRA